MHWNHDCGLGSLMTSIRSISSTLKRVKSTLWSAPFPLCRSPSIKNNISPIHALIRYLRHLTHGIIPNLQTRQFVLQQSFDIHRIGPESLLRYYTRRYRYLFQRFCNKRTGYHYIIRLIRRRNQSDIRSRRTYSRNRFYFLRFVSYE